MGLNCGGTYAARIATSLGAMARFHNWNCVIWNGWFVTIFGLVGGRSIMHHGRGLLGGIDVHAAVGVGSDGVVTAAPLTNMVTYRLASCVSVT